MGNVVSGGEHNDDLVDILRFLGYIQTKKIERVFRAVDRGDYVLAAHREGAYKDLSWKIGNIHLSAPCVYGKVMEGLSLKSGLSFLNLGSGTGYLSTMAGLILNHHGTNHGIELNQDCLEYAYEKLDEFKQKSLALDEFDFCEPVFIHGNCLKLEPNRQYDRVYCGAGCPESHEAFIKQFVKIGGVLVMPYKENLLRIERIGEDTWKHQAMLPVSFAPLVIPKDDDRLLLQLPHSEPLSLQELSRCTIRCELRKLLWKAHPELQSRDLITTGTNKTTQTQPSAPREIIPHSDTFETHSSSDDDEDQSSHAQLFFYVDTDLKGEESVPTTRVVRSIILSRTNESSLDVFGNMSGDSNEKSSKTKNCGTIDTTQSATEADSPSTSYRNDIAANRMSDNDNKSPRTKEIENTKVMNGQSSTLNVVEEANEFFRRYSDVDDAMDLDIPTEQLGHNPNFELINEINSFSSNENQVNESKQNRDQSDMIHNDIEEHSRNSFERDVPMSDSSNSSSSSSDGSSNSSSSSEDCEEDDDDDAISSIDWFHAFERHQNGWGLPAYKCNNEGHLNNCSNQSQTNDTDDQDVAYLPKPRQVFAHNVDINVFSSHMKEKISKLPLPTSILMYINYNRTL